MGLTEGSLAGGAVGCVPGESAGGLSEEEGIRVGVCERRLGARREGVDRDGPGEGCEPAKGRAGGGSMSSSASSSVCSSESAVCADTDSIGQWRWRRALRTRSKSLLTVTSVFACETRAKASARGSVDEGAVAG